MTPRLLEESLETTTADQLRGEVSATRFIENAYDVTVETGSVELPNEYKDLVRTFLNSRNLRYELAPTFKLKPHLPGVFSALVADLYGSTQLDPLLGEAAADFEHALFAVTRSHLEVDMKTCIQKAAMLVEALASACPGSTGQTLGELCQSINCWPHATVREAVKKLYGFCSDYPGIRHSRSAKGKIRPLEMRDSVIVPLLLLTAAGYFGPNTDLMATLRSEAAEPPQIPAEEPPVDPGAPHRNLP